MAEMLIDGAKLDACNTAEADAIRAKTGGADPIPYDFANNKGFADAIAAIPSGGGSLPSIISKIDGGSFTLSSNTLTGSYTVQHNLGITPTNVMVWSDDVTYDTAVRVTVAFAIYSGNYFAAQFNTNGTNRDVVGSVISGDLSASSFKLTVSGNYYKAGATYKWLAWA